MVYSQQGPIRETQLRPEKVFDPSAIGFLAGLP